MLEVLGFWGAEGAGDAGVLGMLEVLRSVGVWRVLEGWKYWE